MSSTLSVTSTSAPSTRAVMAGVIGALVFQVILLIIAGWNNRLMLNPDGIAYIRIASYYASGQTDLMISGYWGPLLSWLMAPLLGVVEHPLDAARIVMGLSAVVFLLGCLSVFQGLQIQRAGVVLGTWIVAAASVFWSVDGITPDLLMSGLLCFAIRRMISPQWINNLSTQLAAGLLCGAAYLAKPVAFPMTFGLGIGLGALWVISRLSSTTQVSRSFLITMLGFALLASPWVVALSLKYKHPTFSTAGTFNYALVGPPDVDRADSLNSTFDTLEPGRITSWEEPSTMPSQTWSPLESVASTKYQFRVIYKTYRLVLHMLQTFDALGIGLFALVCGLLFHTPWRENLGTERWRWAGVPVACLCSVYLLFPFNVRRYYFPVYPFLIAVSMGMVDWLTRKAQKGTNVPRLVGFGLVVGSFTIPALVQLPATLRGLEGQSVYAYELAQRLQAAGIHGALAGVDNFKGAYIAFFMNQPWYDSEPNPTPARLKASQAKLIVVPRSSPLLSALNHDPDFKDLDRVLFESEEKSLKFPWKIYLIITP